MEPMSREGLERLAESIVLSADRLERLVHVGAPAIIVENELQILEGRLLKFPRDPQLKMDVASMREDMRHDVDSH